MGLRGHDGLFVRCPSNAAGSAVGEEEGLCEEGVTDPEVADVRVDLRSKGEECVEG